MASSIGNRIDRVVDYWFGLTPEEEKRIRENAGRPWRTGYYVASRDWPVPPSGMPTLSEAYAAVKDVVAQEGNSDG